MKFFLAIAAVFALPNYHYTPAAISDGHVITLQSDSGKFLGRCNNCFVGGVCSDSAFVHVDDPNNAPWARWTVKDMQNGKYALQADTGKFLARCSDCVPHAVDLDSAFVHIDDPTYAPYAQFTVKQLDNGKISFLFDNGKFLTRCHDCAANAAYPDQAFVHVANDAEPWAQWNVAVFTPY